MNSNDLNDFNFQSAQTDYQFTKDFRKQQTSVNIYKVYYASSGRLQIVSKKTFRTIKAKCIKSGHTKMKVIGMVPSSKLKNLGFECESMFGNIKMVYETILKLTNSAQLMESKMKREHLLPLLTLGLKYTRYHDKQITFIDLMILLIDTYSVLSTTFPSWIGEEEKFKAESSLETLLCGTISMFLPSKLVEIIKRANLFSNSKLVDDFGGFHSLFTMIVDFVSDICNRLPIPQKIRELVTSFLNFLNIGEHHRLISEAQTIIDLAADGKVYLDERFRNRVKDVHGKINESLEIASWKMRSPGVKKICSQLVDVYRISNNYSNASRQEPNLFIFEGQAGCGKSVLLNLIVQCLQDTTYVHTVKASMDGKDFYDSYNNQTNMVLDDLGQQGMSQWRQIINFISCVICPLDCASVDLKDTKFMNSRRVIATTNQFMSLNGVTKQDCITELSALHRRGYVFDFKNVTFIDGMHIGTLVFRRYDLATATFINALPIGMKKFLSDRNESLELTIEITKDNQEELLVFILDIMNACDAMKNSHYNSSVLPDDTIRRVREKTRFQAEGGVIGKSAFDLAEGAYTYVSAPKVNNDKTLIKRDSGIEENEYSSDVPWFARAEPVSWKTYFSSMSRDEEYQVKRGYLYKVYHSAWFGEAIKAFFEYFCLMYIVNLKSAMFSGDLLTIIITLWSIYSLLSLLYTFGRSIIKGCAKITHKVFDTISTNTMSTFEAQSRIYADMATNLAKTHSSTQSILKNNTFVVELKADDVCQSSMGILSERSVIVPAHIAVKEIMVLTAYSANKQVVVDKHIVRRVYLNDKDDVAIYNLSPSYPSPFKSIVKHLKNTTTVGSYENANLINCFGAIPIGDIIIKPEERVSSSYKRVVDSYPTYINSFDKDKDLFYNVRFSGMCGTVAVDNTHGILGMHVAGSSALGIGVSIIWSSKVKEEMKKVLSQSAGWNIGLPLAEQDRDGESVVQIDFKGGVTLNKDSNIIPTELHGIYEVTRKPANLRKYGVGTTSEVFKKSTSPCSFVKIEAIEFAKETIRHMLSPFDKLSEEETIKGSAEKNLAGMNKESSNGYEYNLEKNDYIDFDKGVVLPPFRERLDHINSLVSSRIYPTGDMVYVECLKDELKPIDKDPRTFRIGTLGNQFLTKQYFGNMVSHIIKNRDFNMIQVGINPYVEWSKLYDRIESCSLKWAGDISKWDGKMSAEVQQSVVEVILEFVADDNKEMSQVLLSTLMNSLVIVANKTFLTTHSFPSGSFLTAIVNSLVNRFYTALWYYESLSKNRIKPTVSEYFDIVVDYVYGDDKLNGVKSRVDILNAVTMRDFFESLGMTLTDSQKNPLVNPGQRWEEITFLKRSFYMHGKIGRIMCPLSKETLYTGIQFYDRSKEYNVVIQDKINAFQREMYLHNDYEREMALFEQKLKQKEFVLVKIPERTLHHLYTVDINQAYKYGWGQQIQYI